MKIALKEIDEKAQSMIGSNKFRTEHVENTERFLKIAHKRILSGHMMSKAGADDWLALQLFRLRQSRQFKYCKS